MERLKAKFEKDLKGKLFLKSNAHQTEEILLLKNFKYFDKLNTDTCDLDIFIKVLSKVGLYGFTETELEKLFNMYSGNKEIMDYKNFIGVVFDNASLLREGEEAAKGGEEQPRPAREEPEKNNQPQNEEEMDPIEELLMKLRNKLSQRGLPNLIKMESGFRVLDTENEQAINLDTFKKACEQFDLGLNDDEVKDLFQTFDREETGTINYDEFLRVLRGELSEKRKKLVHDVFDNLRGENNAIPVKELLNLYEPRGSIEYLDKGFPENEALQIFEETFKDNHLYLHGEDDYGKPVDSDEFEDYYESVSLMIPDDELFKDVILRTWGLLKEEPKQQPKEQQQSSGKKQERIEEIPEPEAKREEPIREEKKVEELTPKKETPTPKKEAPKKVDPYKAKREKEREFRKNLLNEQNIDTFRSAIGAKGIVPLMNFVNTFHQYDRKGDKEIPYDDFEEIINHAGLNMPEEEIKDLYNDFVPKEKNTINYGEFLSSLVGDLNPRRKNVVSNAFKKLDLDKCEVINLSDIKTNFNCKNSPMVTEGVMTEEDFYNTFMESFQTHHNIFRSPKIKKVNWEEFLDYYKYYSITVDEDFLFEKMLVSAWGLSKSPFAHAGPKDNVKTLFQGQKPDEKTDENEDEKKRTAKKYFSAKDNKACPYGVDDKKTDYSNYLHPNGSLVGIRLNKNDNPLEFFRKKIIARGIRGIMALRRTFLLYDESNSGKLSHANFHKYIVDYRLPVNREYENALFNMFEQDNDGNIDYNEFVAQLVGQMNKFRRQLIEQVYNKLDKEETGKVPYSTVKNEYNPASHPEVLNGTRSYEEVLGRFVDFFEYHFNLLDANKDKDKDYVTLKDFLEFYDYISMFIEDDTYFESVVSRVWELRNERDYARKRNQKASGIF